MIVRQTSEMTGYPSIDKPWLKYYSDEALNTEMPRCTAYDYLWKSNKDYLNNIALNYFGRKICFSELFECIEKVAAAYQRFGIKPGDIVVFTTVTTPETIYSFYALSRIGAIANMVDPRTSAEGIRDYITETESKIIVTLDVAYPKIKDAIEGTGIEKVCELLGEDIKNTIAFGDSINDKEMLITANVGIAMGRASEDAKKYADDVTDYLENDGIYNALEKYNII